MSFIRFEKVTRIYHTGEENVKALDGISFEVEEGQFTVILGPSGSGKSTTLNLLGGMDRATSGKITVGKKEITSLDDNRLTVYRRHNVGFVFQFYNLIPNLTAFENVDLACRLGKSPLSARETIDAVGLSKRMNNFPSELSGGELQRISIARALCKNPQLILCDEPTGALDSETGKRILTLLQSMSRRYRNAVVVVTHNSLIAPTADRVIHLKDGRVQTVENNDSPLAMEEVVW
ncbi:MAG: ABC transporter ATP-binding protein [Ethanoligenens sp.]